MILEKKCKGQDAAQGFDGCGCMVNVKERKYGLCQKCLREFYTSTEEGKAKMSKAIIVAKKETKNKIKEEKKENILKKKEFNENDSKWLKGKIQDGINYIVKFIDYGHPCLATGLGSCGIGGGQFHAGHLFSRGHNLTIAFNLHNIHRQKASSNHFQSDDLKLWNGLKSEFGEDYCNFVSSLKQTPKNLYTSKDLLVIKLKVDILVLEIKKSEPQMLSKEGLIRKRNEINLRLGIYDQEYAEFVMPINDPF